MASNNSPFQTSKGKRSPFPRKSLPQAGESGRDAAFDLIFDKFFVFSATAITIGGVAAVEWACKLLHAPIGPGWWAFVALVCGAIAIWRWFSIQPQLNALLLGVRGERQVGRMLEGMRVLGYEVFHDLPGEGFNVDHALIGPAGVFAIETKTRTKPGGRRAEVKYDGTCILVDGQTPDRDPVRQAKAQADHLHDLLKRMADREVFVRPVVLYPGWWIADPSTGPHVWVLNPDLLRGFLKKLPTKLSREDVALFAERMALHLSAE